MKSKTYPLYADDTSFGRELESVRMDAECFFGRVIIFNLHIIFRKRCNVFFTCCNLHKILHAFDGLEVLEAIYNMGILLFSKIEDRIVNATA